MEKVTNQDKKQEISNNYLAEKAGYSQHTSPN
jgi:hypothetical protein